MHQVHLCSHNTAVAQLLVSVLDHNLSSRADSEHLCPLEQGFRVLTNEMITMGAGMGRLLRTGRRVWPGGGDKTDACAKWVSEGAAMAPWTCHSSLRLLPERAIRQSTPQG